MNSFVVWMRRSTLVAAMGLLALGTGCGGGGGYHPAYVGTLGVVNAAFSTDILDALDVDEVAGPDHFSFSVGLFPGEAFDVDLYPSQYDVTIYWRDGRIEFDTVNVFNGTVTVLTASN